MKRHLWSIALGIGIGVGLGAIIAKGIGFTSADVARFIGALIGSLIAVAGAVALYFLKEFEDRAQKTGDYRDLLIGAKVFCIKCERRFKGEDEDVSLHTALRAVETMWSRVMRFGRAHEFDVHAIGHAYHMLTAVETDFEELLGKDNFSTAELTHVSNTMAIHVKVIDRAILELDNKKPRKSE